MRNFLALSLASTGLVGILLLARDTIAQQAATGADAQTSVSEQAEAESPAVAEARLRQLLGARLEVLSTRHEALLQLYFSGLATFESTIDAQEDLLEAQLDLAATKQQRIAAIQALLEVAIDREKMVVARVDQGTIPITDKLLATSARLKMEIRLLRAQLAQ